MPFPLHILPPEDFAALTSALAGAGYTEESICARTGQDKIEEFQMIRDGRAEKPLSDCLDALVDLFLDARLQPAETARNLIGEPLWTLLNRAGLIQEIEGGQCASTMLFHPAHGLYLASDRYWPVGGTSADLAPDVVYAAMTANSFQFLRSLPTSRCEALLELCGGTGVAAIHGARHAARQAWTVDIAGRSVECARWNAHMNGVPEVASLQGDLFEPVRGMTFDRIVAHPPYVAALEDLFLFRDAGADGEQVLRRIIEGVPEFLRPGGTCHLVTMATDRKDAPVEQRIRQMLGEAQGEFDVLIIVKTAILPPDYLIRQAAAGMRKFDEVQGLLDVFERLEIKSMLYCSIVLQRREGARRVFTARRRSPAPLGDGVMQAVALETANLDPRFLNWLGRARIRVAGHVSFRVTYRRVEGVWTPAECLVMDHGMFPGEASCPPWVAPFLTLCDGTRTAAQLCVEMKRNGAVPPESPDIDFARFVAGFVVKGYLEAGEAQ